MQVSHFTYWYSEWSHAECYHARWNILFHVMLNVIMLSFVILNVILWVPQICSLCQVSFCQVSSCQVSLCWVLWRPSQAYMWADGFAKSTTVFKELFHPLNFYVIHVGLRTTCLLKKHFWEIAKHSTRVASITNIRLGINCGPRTGSWCSRLLFGQSY